MEDEIKAPINYIGDYCGKRVLARGHIICVGTEMYPMPYHVHNVLTDANCVIAYGKYFIGIIDSEKNVKHYKFNYLVCRVWSYADNYWALTSNGNVYTLKNELIVISKLQFTLSAGDALGKYLFCGNLFGYVFTYILKTGKNENTFFREKKKIHEGTIYDIRASERYIVSCSNDRSICLMSPDLTLLYRVYNNRDRFFKCSVIFDEKFIAKLIRFKCEIKSSENKDNIYFYGITDNGNLRIYMNDQLIYKYEPDFAMIDSVHIGNGILTCGYRSGLICIKHIETIHNVTSSYDQECKINNNTIDTRNGNKLKTFMQKNDKNYAANKNKLYQLRNGCYEFVADFEQPIISIGNSSVTLAGGIALTSQNYEKTKLRYELKHVTSSNNDFIGTRYGFLIYHTTSTKICKDGITDILVHNEDVYISSRDGCIYFIPEYKTLFPPLKINSTLIFKDDLRLVNQDLIRYKKLTTDYIDGLLLFSDQVFGYSFSHNSLHLCSFIDKFSFYIGCKPKRYYFKGLSFFYKKKSEFWELELVFGKSTNEDLFIKSIYTPRNFYLITENHIYNIKDRNIYDRQCSTEISVVKYINSKLFIGSQSGHLKIFDEYKNRLWQIYETLIKTRIIDINSYRAKKKEYVIILDGFGNITRMACNSKYELQFLGLYSEFFVFSFYCANRLYLISSNGNLHLVKESDETLNIDELKPLHRNSMVQVKYCAIQNIHYLLTFGDDHTINCYNHEFKKLNSLICHTGTIVDLIVFENSGIGVSLAIDKTVVAFYIPSLIILWRKKIHLNKPQCLVLMNGLYAFGQGYELLDINLKESVASNSNIKA